MQFILSKTNKYILKMDVDEHHPLEELPDEILLNIAHNLQGENLLRFGEYSDTTYRIINDPYFLQQISNIDFGQIVDTLDAYRQLAATTFITRDSPIFIGLDESLRQASKVHDIILITMFINQGTRNWNYGLLGAAEGDHMDLIDYFSSGGADINYGLRGGAITNNMKLIKYFMSQGANNWNLGLQGAVEGNHIELIQYFISLGAKDFDQVIPVAVQNNNREIVNLLIAAGASIKSVFIEAARNGNTLLMQSLDLRTMNVADIRKMYKEALLEAADNDSFQYIFNQLNGTYIVLFPIDELDNLIFSALSHKKNQALSFLLGKIIIGTLDNQIINYLATAIEMDNIEAVKMLIELRNLLHLDIETLHPIIVGSNNPRIIDIFVRQLRPFEVENFALQAVDKFIDKGYTIALNMVIDGLDNYQYVHLIARALQNSNHFVEPRSQKIISMLLDRVNNPHYFMQILWNALACNDRKLFDMVFTKLSTSQHAYYYNIGKVIHEAGRLGRLDFFDNWFQLIPIHYIYDSLADLTDENIVQYILQQLTMEQLHTLQRNSRQRGKTRLHQLVMEEKKNRRKKTKK